MIEQSTLLQALERYRRGDLAGAEALARPLLPTSPLDPSLNGLLGMIAVQTKRLGEALPFLRVAHRASPDNVPLRISLGFALANNGLFDEARRVAARSDVPQLQRIVAFVDQQQGRHRDAIAGYRQVLAGFAEDAESWNNLGLLLSAEGEVAEAVEAFRRAIALRQDPSFYVNFSRAYAAGERHMERRQLLEDIVLRIPDNVSLLVELGLAAGAVGDFAAAEAAYRAALALAPREPLIYLEFGMMLESLNRLNDLAELISQGRSHQVNAVEIDFIEAWLMKRQGRFSEALRLAEGAKEGINPSRRAQLIGDLADRLDDPAKAFAAFSDMNRLSMQGAAAAYARSIDYPGEMAAVLEALSPNEIARWTPASIAPNVSAPVFLVGFPRSGTTLLDTLLMNLPELEVLEEMPMVERVEAMVGGPSKLASLSAPQIDRLRACYFDFLRELKPPTDARLTIVDKFPLHLVRAPFIHRIFPDARFVMVERHPCDVVLSCFMSRFQTNRATVQFQDLHSTARLYDSAMEIWTRTEALLPLRVHRLRYERMLDDLEGEIRPLLDFLNVPWRPEVLDNQGSAMRRAHVPTASYAQVTEPIYQRARNRWHRYRQFLAPVLPILAPWAERMGYPV